MISFQMTDEQRDMQRLARRFAEEEMRPVAPECDEQERFPRDVYEKAHRAGLITYRFPEEYLGGGVDSLLTSCIISEELVLGMRRDGHLLRRDRPGRRADPLVWDGRAEAKVAHFPVRSEACPPRGRLPHRAGSRIRFRRHSDPGDPARG